MSRISTCPRHDFPILQQIVCLINTSRAKGRLPAKIKGIFLATRTHAFNLAKFVTIYKVFLLLQKKLNGGKERDLDSLIAGGLGGWWVFGERTAVCLYIVSSNHLDSNIELFGLGLSGGFSMNKADNLDQ